MKKIKKFSQSILRWIYEQTKVTVEWETLTRDGKFEFSLLHVVMVIAILILIWTVL